MSDLASPVIVTGCRHAGVLTVKLLMERLGMRLDYEKTYSPFSLTLNGSPDPAFEASWMAAPYLTYAPQSTIVVRPVIAPLATLSMLMSDPMMEGEGPQGVWLKNLIPTLFYQNSLLMRCLMFMTYWDGIIDDVKDMGVQVMDIKVDDMSAHDVKSILATVEPDFMQMDARDIQKVMGPAILDDHDLEGMPSSQQMNETARVVAMIGPDAATRVDRMEAKYGYGVRERRYV